MGLWPEYIFFLNSNVGIDLKRPNLIPQTSDCDTGKVNLLLTNQIQDFKYLKNKTWHRSV